MHLLTSNSCCVRNKTGSPNIFARRGLDKFRRTESTHAKNNCHILFAIFQHNELHDVHRELLLKRVRVCRLLVRKAEKGKTTRIGTSKILARCKRRVIKVQKKKLRTASVWTSLFRKAMQSKTKQSKQSSKDSTICSKVSSRATRL